MNKGLALLSGAGMGAALMYICDPNAGRRRRALARDQVVSAFYQAGNAIGPTAEDLRNRSYGVFADLTGRFAERDVSDRVLVERVRARLGRHVSHPGSIEVSVREGLVTLSGSTLAHEVDDLLDAVSSTRGIRGVENHLEVHERPGNVPGLQGGSAPRGGRFELLQTSVSQ